MGSPESIADFYTGANVFVTGATGFLGKVLLEKLLRSCENIQNIFVLVKPKKDFSSEQRLQQLRESRIFDRIRQNSPERLNKIRCVHGDVEKPQLGLANGDKNLIIDTVHMVFHSAATVHFMREFKSTVTTNTFGTENIAELCKEIKHLRCFVYVSTLYSRTDNDIDEIIYEPPYSLATLKDYMTKIPAEATKFLGNHKNPYTLSKAFAEKLISQYESFFPIAIIRPSIISSAWKEPYPGWIESYGGATGVILLFYLGVIKDLFIRGLETAEIIPVDVVANTIITAAWSIVANRSTTVKVYNCTSTKIDNVTWKKFTTLLLFYGRMYPSRHVLRYPTANIVKNELWFDIRFFFNQTVPLFMYDTILKFMGHHSKLLERSFLGRKNMFATEFATHRSLNCCTTNFQELTEEVKNCKDGIDFSMDMTSYSGFAWESYIKDYILGIRQYVLNDDLGSVEKARVKLRRIYWVNNVIWSALLIISFAIVFRLGTQLIYY